ncbi:unnamed protein product, partial [marine sediment metagenome]
IEQIYRTISSGPGRESILMGARVAAWDDSGLHHESFWLGWVGGAEWAWSPGIPQPEEYVAKFMRLFYGPDVENMVEVYRLLDACARFWDQAWDRVPSRRGPSYFRPSHARWDRTIALPHLPELPTLDNRPFFVKCYSELLRSAGQQEKRLERLLHLLMDNMGRASRNRYNLEVLVSLARFLEHHVRLLRALAMAETMLDEARTALGQARFKEAESHLRSAGDALKDVADDRERMYDNLRTTWERSRYPKGQSVNGREFLHVMDDTKDHWADRTPDMSYLIMWERGLGLEEWAKRLESIADDFANLSAEYRQRCRPLTKEPVW